MRYLSLNHENHVRVRAFSNSCMCIVATHAAYVNLRISVYILYGGFSFPVVSELAFYVCTCPQDCMCVYIRQRTYMPIITTSYYMYIAACKI